MRDWNVVGSADALILGYCQLVGMANSVILGRTMVLRGGVSLYLTIDPAWQDSADLGLDDTCRLEIEEVGESSLTVALFIDENYSAVADPLGQFDIEPVDIQTRPHPKLGINASCFVNMNGQ